MTYNAPPVVYPLGRSRFQAWMLAGLWCAGALSLLVWTGSGRQAAWHFAFALGALSIAGLAAFAGWKNTATGRLRWDGRSWRWEVSAYRSGIDEQSISVIADFQNVLLLRMENQARKGICIWCERAAFPERWLDFRRAIFSPGRHPDQKPAVAVSGDAQAASPRMTP